ncbi:MAG: DUF3987 domain-containing protein, partial [Planctomycetaceae bacterium]|nr:DUF3987 domain-containing protein [Planctomycetaceae bacterium]
MTPVDLVLSRLKTAKRNGKGWSACCPAHEDRNPSLSIWQMDNGSAAVKCFAGCPNDAVLAAIGLTWRDLKPPPDERPPGCATKPRKPKPKPGESSPSPPAGPSFATADEAVAALVDRLGPLACDPWPYHSTDGELVGMVCRWDRPDGTKTIRPVSLIDGRWRHAGMPEPRPLYRWPDLLADEVVFVCEGEKAADAVRSLGLVATTSPHGAKSADKTDWSPLAGKQVVILPDNDAPGVQYAETVAALLLSLNPPPRVRIVTLDGLPNAGDAFDWIEQRDAIDPDQLADQLVTLAAATPLCTPDDVAETPVGWQPFPVAVLPEPLRGFVLAAARAMQVDPSYVALPLLAVCAAAIGNYRRIRLKPGWTEPACLWTAIVGESGDCKSAPLDIAFKAMRSVQKLRLKDFAEKQRQYEQRLADYERDLAKYKSGKITEFPQAPVEPTPERLVIDNTTTEAVAVLLQQNPRGLLVAKDELSGWLASFDRYASGKGGDAAAWLEMFGGRQLVIDRKSSKRPLFVPMALVSVAGSIQREVLKRLLSVEHRENGLAARLLFADPPKRVRRWTEAGITRAAEESIARLIDRLMSLEPQVDANGDPEPVLVDLSAEAKPVWIDFYNDHAEQQATLSGELAAAWSKLHGYAARLALVLHFVRWAAEDPTLPAIDDVDVVTLRAAITLSRWFGNEAKRIYTLLHETEDQ